MTCPATVCATFTREGRPRESRGLASGGARPPIPLSPPPQPQPRAQGHPARRFGGLVCGGDAPRRRRPRGLVHDARSRLPPPQPALASAPTIREPRPRSSRNPCGRDRRSDGAVSPSSRTRRGLPRAAAPPLPGPASRRSPLSRASSAPRHHRLTVPVFIAAAAAAASLRAAAAAPRARLPPQRRPREGSTSDAAPAQSRGTGRPAGPASARATPIGCQSEFGGGLEMKIIVVVHY